MTVELLNTLFRFLDIRVVRFGVNVKMSLKHDIGS